MKIIQLIVVCNLICISAFSQVRTMTYDSIQKMYYKVDGKDTVFFDTPPNVIFADRIRPVFEGNMENFIKENLVYPEEAKKGKLEGYVNIYCQLDSNGVPNKILVMYATSPLFEKEAERVVSLMRWKWDEKEPFKEHWAEHIKIDFKL